MKKYIKKFLPIILAVSIVFCSCVLCANVFDFGSLLTPVASAANANDLVYTDFGDGTCYINGFCKIGEVDSAGELIIPETLNGMTVTGISKNAFENCTELTRVVLPDTVKVIEQSAFSGCTNLEEIVISDNITTIGWSAFANCIMLNDITIPDSVTSVGSNAFYNTAYYNDDANWENGILYLDNCLVSAKSDITGELTIKDGTRLMVSSAFKGNKAITKVTFPGSMLTISKEAFRECTNLIEVVLLEGVKEIGEMAFWNCPKLVKITIPASFQKVGSSAFGNTRIKEPYYNGTVDQWVSIEFEHYSDNPIYAAKTLYINGEEITEAVISAPIVKKGAFANCKTLEKVILTDSVVEIEEQAFWYTFNLKEINFGKSITKVGRNVFEYCSNIEKVNTTASVNEWAQIDFYNGQSNPISISNSLYVNDILLENATFSDITEIKPYTFYNCDSLKSIKFADTVEIINKGAFSGCENLAQVEFSNSVQTIGESAFSNCSNLAQIEIADSVKTFCEDAFVNSTNINYVNFQGSFDQWINIDFAGGGANPISYAKSLYINGKLLEEVNFENITEIKPYIFSGCASIKIITIPDTVETIGAYAFSGTSITSIDIPSSVKTIDVGAFSKTLIENLVIQDGTTIIGGSAFKNCINLKSVYIPDSVTEIQTYVFKGCSALESVDLPNTVTRYSSEEFYGCTSLKKVNYRGTIDEWSSMVFYSETSNPVYYSRCLYLNDVLLENAVIKEAKRVNDNTFIHCDSIKTLVVGGNTESINGAFVECQGLTSVEIQESIRWISVYSFKGCSSLVELNISEEGEPVNLSSGAFYECSALEEIVLPKRIERIGNQTFSRCTSLKTVYISAELERIGYDAFYHCPSLEIVYYESDEEAYAEINIQQGNEALLTAETHYNVHDIESHYTTITVNATCTEDGSITKTCPCGYSSFTIIHAASHKPIVINKHDATCTTDGYTGDTICEACKEVFEQGVIIECLGHIGGTSTCSKQALCERCNQYYGETLPHSYTNNWDTICNECGYELNSDSTENESQDNVQNSVQDNIQNNVQDNVQKPNQDSVQDNVQKPVQNDAQNPEHDNVQSPVQDNTVQNNEQKPVQDNTHSSIQDNIQKPIQNNTQKLEQDNIENVTQDNTENSIQNTVQDTVQNKVPDNTQAPKTVKPYYIVVSLVLASGLALSGVYISKKKQKATK